MQTKLSWKTSVTGFLAVASAVIGNFFPQYQSVFNTVSGVLAGLGLVAARDNNVTSEQAGLK